MITVEQEVEFRPQPLAWAKLLDRLKASVVNTLECKRLHYVAGALSLGVNVCALDFLQANGCEFIANSV